VVAELNTGESVPADSAMLDSSALLSSTGPLLFPPPPRLRQDASVRTNSAVQMTSRELILKSFMGPPF
jgi:hypothetical protein